MIYSDTTPDEHLQALKSSSHPPSAYKLLGRELTAGFNVLITWWLSPVQSPAHPSHLWPHSAHTKHKGSSPYMHGYHSWGVAPKRRFRNFPTLGEQRWDASLGLQAWGSPQKCHKAAFHWWHNHHIITSPSLSPIHSNSSWSCFFSKSASFPLRPEKQPRFLST